MSASCKIWRAALVNEEEELWRELVLRYFPRMRAILELSSDLPASYCQLYREQRAAESPIVPTRKTSLSDYIFTVEMALYPTKEIMRWTGTFSHLVTNANGNHGLAQCADGYPRFDASAARFRQIRRLVNEGEMTPVLTVYVTHKLKTVKLYVKGKGFGYEDSDDDDDDPIDEEREGLFQFGCDAMPRRFGQTELWADPVAPEAEPTLAWISYLTLVLGGLLAKCA